jgi:hypothetical protein
VSVKWSGVMGGPIGRSQVYAYKGRMWMYYEYRIRYRCICAVCGLEQITVDPSASSVTVIPPYQKSPSLCTSNQTYSPGSSNLSRSAGCKSLRVGAA